MAPPSLMPELPGPVADRPDGGARAELAARGRGAAAGPGFRPGRRNVAAERLGPNAPIAVPPGGPSLSDAWKTNTAPKGPIVPVSATQPSPKPAAAATKPAAPPPATGAPPIMPPAYVAPTDPGKEKQAWKFPSFKRD